MKIKIVRYNGKVEILKVDMDKTAATLNNCTKGYRLVQPGYGELTGNEVIGEPATFYEVQNGKQVIFVKGLNGETYPIAFEPTTTIAELKEAIKDKNSEYMVDAQRLIYTGKQLEDNKTVADYNITASNTLHLVIRRPVKVILTARIKSGDSEYDIEFTPGETTIGRIRYLCNIPKESKILLDSRELKDEMILIGAHQGVLFTHQSAKEKQPVKGGKEVNPGNLKGFLTCIALGGLVSLGYYKCSSTSFGSKLLGEFSPKICAATALLGAVLSAACMSMSSGQSK